MSESLLEVISYGDAEWVWVSDHYDIHLKGLLRYEGRLCRFETNYETAEVSIYSLRPDEKVRWLISKKLFEWCVGYHWTYPERKQGVHCYVRWPRWFWKLVFRYYYKCSRLMKKIGLKH